MNQCIQMLPSDLAIWKNTILFLCLKEEKKKSRAVVERLLEE